MKAIFDADILIHLIDTDSIELALETMDYIYISEYVYLCEIREGTKASKLIKKQINKQRIMILKFEGLTSQQKKVYMETYRLLKREDISNDPYRNPINEGERVTAAFAKACNIYYYMSDDNIASPYIRSLTAIEVVNFCDLLYIYIRIFGKGYKEKLEECYNSFVNSYNEEKRPRIVKNNGMLITFIEMMGRCYDKFNKSDKLGALLKNIELNINKRSSEKD